MLENSFPEKASLLQALTPRAMAAVPSSTRDSKDARGVKSPLAASGGGATSSMQPSGLGGASTAVGATLRFDASAFDAPDFDVGAWVSAQSRIMPLEALREDLDRFVQAIKGKLVGYINTDYAEFVQLSAKLDGFKAKARQLQGPLGAFRDEAEAARSHAEQALGKVDNLVRQAEAAAVRRRRLENFLHGHRLAALVGNLLDQLQAGAETGDEDSADMRLERCLMLERVAESCWQLEQLMVAEGVDSRDGAEGAGAVGGGPLFLRMLLTKLRSSRATLSAELRSMFVTLLRSEGDMDQEAVGACLRAFAFSDQAAIVEHLVSESLIQPYLADNLTQGKIDGGTRGEFRGLNAAYRGLTEHVQSRRVAAVVVACEDVEGIDLVGNGIWSPIVHWLLDKFASLFSAGQADVFLRSYLAFQSFAADFLGTLSKLSPHAAATLQRHSATAEVAAKWQRALPVYFQLRSRTMRSDTEAALAKGVSIVDSSSSDRNGLRLHGSVAVWATVVRMWHSDVFVLPLGARFIRLMVQALRRYVSWMQTGVQPRKEKADAGAAGESASAESDSKAFDDAGVWAGTSVEELLAAAQDASRMQVLLEAEALPLIKTAFGEGYSDAVSIAHEAIASIKTELSALVSPVDDQVGMLLASRCCEGLSHVKGIPAMYRMTSKPVPKTHSPYVDLLSDPLTSFLKKHRRGFPTGSDRTKTLADAVLGEVAEHYGKAVAQLLVTVEKMDKSLKWLKSSGTAGAGDAGNLADSDKIRIQVLLDVDKFLGVVSHVGLDAGAGQFGELRGRIESLESLRSKIPN